MELPQQLGRASLASAQFYPEWSPDGSKIVFTIGADASSSIVVVETDGSGMDVIAEGGEGRSPRSNVSPRISPDGSMIAYAGMVVTRSRADGSRQLGRFMYGWEIFTSRIDGSRKRRLTDNYGITDTNPTWSPDGTQLALMSRGGTASDGTHFTMAADGSDIRQLTPFRRNDGSPLLWSPDGRKLALYAWPEDEPLYTIQTVNSDGSDLRKVTNTRNPGASWSPDSQRLAFVIAYSDDDYLAMRGLGKGLYTAAPDGADLRRILKSTDSPGIGWGVVNVAWSPDGSEILLAWQGELWTVRPDGSDLRWLYTDPKLDGTRTTAAWSSDGSRIAFHINAFPRVRLVTMARDGTDVSLLVECRFAISSLIEDGCWLGSEAHE